MRGGEDKGTKKRDIKQDRLLWSPFPFYRASPGQAPPPASAGRPMGMRGGGRRVDGGDIDEHLDVVQGGRGEHW